MQSGQNQLAAKAHSHDSHTRGFQARNCKLLRDLLRHAYQRGSRRFQNHVLSFFSKNLCFTTSCSRYGRH